MGLAGNIDRIGYHMRELRTVDDRGGRVEGFGTGVLREGDKWECMQILGELDRTNSLYFDRVSQIKMEGWSKGRVALVGDAAFCVSQMVGQGSAPVITAAYVLAGELAGTAGEHEAGFRANEKVRAHISDRSRRLPSEFRPHLHQRLGGAVPAQPSDSGVRNLMVGETHLWQEYIVGKLQLPDYCWPALASASYRFTRLLLRNSISAFQCLNAAGISDASVSLELSGSAQS